MKQFELANQHRRSIPSKAAGVMAVFLVMALLLAAAAPAAAAPAGEVFPEVIPLPNGFRPEGIAVGYGPTFYVGSIPTGAIYQGNLQTGEGGILVEPQAGRAAIGLEFDPSSGFLFVAGGPTGKGFVYDGQSGDLLAEFTFNPSTATFVNDVFVTREAAYFTDSPQAHLYRVALGPGGALPGASEFEVIPLSGDYVHQVGAFNANGITGIPNGKWLIIVQSATGSLFRVDPATGETALIELAGGVVMTNGDGLLMIGHTLYVVQNRLNKIAVIELTPDFTSGEVVDEITNAAFAVPTTIASFGKYLYAVNARFPPPPQTPDTPYEVVQVTR